MSTEHPHVLEELIRCRECEQRLLIELTRLEADNQRLKVKVLELEQIVTADIRRETGHWER